MLLKAIPLVLLLAQVSDSDLPKKFKEAQEFVAAVAKKMPLWDTDALGQFERPEIAQVKEDITAANQADDPDAFLIDVQQLRDDWDLLVALDNSLHTRKVI